MWRNGQLSRNLRAKPEFIFLSSAKTARRCLLFLRLIVEKEHLPGVLPGKFSVLYVRRLRVEHAIHMTVASEIGKLCLPPGLEV
jgi:hypothetical protein